MFMSVQEESNIHKLALFMSLCAVFVLNNYLLGNEDENNVKYYTRTGTNEKTKKRISCNFTPLYLHIHTLRTHSHTYIYFLGFTRD